jgi:hypothetical protein
LALAVYWGEAGITSTAIGAWVASSLSGVTRVAVWISLTAVLDVGAVQLTERAVGVLGRSFGISSSKGLSHGR